MSYCYYTSLRLINHQYACYPCDLKSLSDMKEEAVRDKQIIRKQIFFRDAYFKKVKKIINQNSPLVNELSSRHMIIYSSHPNG